ncbi:MAG TPA: hypothetical protein VG456_06945 [Candidatus Sulfopaludibacter sp.]|jgi:proteasome lid subunit RPN8/RPN11|nr:hypothetical protein [Candidatus Sulfopaludibacter sp.]
MAESPIDTALGTWNVPECPFTIEYLPRVLDDIRLAVVDAFFSLPRGGAEIGGILLGNHSEGKVTISEYVALDCEHATGPSFVLSPNDEVELRKLLERSTSEHPALTPVGWYHSHTRSDVFLSDADLAIHKQFFPEPWQVALVFKPHTFQPMRCGFFFREADGSIHASATYREFVLETIPLRPVPINGMAAPASEVETTGLVIDIKAAVPEEAPAPAPVEEAPLPIFEAPTFGMPTERKSWPWMKTALGLVLGCGVCIAGFQFGQNWLPKFVSSGKTATKAVVTASAPVPASASGDPKEIAKLKQDLAAQIEETHKVERMLADQSLLVSQATKMKDRVAELEQSLSEAKAQAADVAKLRKDLAASNDRNRKLSKSLTDTQNELKQQQRKRLGNQDPAK